MQTTTNHTEKHSTQTTDNTKRHRMPQTPTEYDEYLAAKFLQIVNSPQFAVYDGFLDDSYFDCLIHKFRRKLFWDFLLYA